MSVFDIFKNFTMNWETIIIITSKLNLDADFTSSSVRVWYMLQTYNDNDNIENFTRNWNHQYTSKPIYWCSYVRVWKLAMIGNIISYTDIINYKLLR